MIMKLATKIMTTLAVALLLIVAMPAVQTSAQVDDGSKKAACEGLAVEPGEECDDSAKQEIAKLLSSVINILSWIVGIVSVIMIIVGGLKFVLSNGDSSGIASARSTVIYALVGLVVAALAQVLVAFVLNRIAKS